MQDLISIIVPVYNVENYLDKCIQSIVEQTYKNIEIILIDDGSTDNSGKKCDEWAKKDNRIKVVHKKNGGVSSARNVGIDSADGEYIGFVDGDDYINKYMYEIMYNEIKKDNVDLVMCDYQRVLPESQVQNCQVDGYSTEIFDKTMMLQMFFPYFGSVWLSLYVKEKLENIKFDINRYIGEDLKFNCDYIVKCKNNGIHIKSKLYYYRLRNESVTRINNSKEKRLQYYIASIDAIKNTELMIIENCNEEDIILNTKKNTVSAYWNYIYGILNEKLTTNKDLKIRYSDELKEHKKYFSLKDKVYMFTLKINPNLFKITYKNIKRIKKLLNKEVN